MNLEQAQNKADVILSEVKNINIPKIETDDDYGKASDSIAFINKKVQAIEEVRKTMTKPLLERQRQINGAFKPLTTAAKKVLDQIKDKMLAYHKLQEEEQKLLEAKAMKESNESELIVDDKIANIKKSEFSSNTKKTNIKYRLKDETLEDVISIKQLKLKEWLKTNKLPVFMEQYETEAIVVRRK